MTLLLKSIKLWECPRRCGFTKMTNQAQPHQPYHSCPQFAGLEVPLVELGTGAKVQRQEREDYVGSEVPRLDENGRPVMAVKVTTDKGENVNVFAPVAGVKGS